MYGTYPSNKPLTKKEIEAIERDIQAENDIRCLIEAEKIKKDQERLAAALQKKKKMQEELERIVPKPTEKPKG